MTLNRVCFISHFFIRNFAQSTRFLPHHDFSLKLSLLPFFSITPNGRSVFVKNQFTLVGHSEAHLIAVPVEVLPGVGGPNRLVFFGVNDQVVVRLHSDPVCVLTGCSCCPNGRVISISKNNEVSVLLLGNKLEFN